MTKPIITISDFGLGITYDETELVENGFSDLVNIDIKTSLWYARLPNAYTSTWLSYSTRLPVNSAVEYSLLPDVTWTGKQLCQSFYLDRVTGTDVMMLDQSIIWSGGDSISLLWSTGGVGFPLKSEIALFNNRLIFGSGPKEISSIWLWTSGSYNSIAWNWTSTITISQNGNWYPFMSPLKYLTGGTLYYWNGSTFVGIGIISVTVVSPGVTTMVLNSTLATWNYYWYAISPKKDGIIKDDGTTLATNALPNGAFIYRPIINFANNLYIWDGKTICQIDNLISTFNGTNKNGSLSVGNQYTIKQIEKIWSNMYILVDEFMSEYFSYNTVIPLNIRSRLLIWDGKSNSFQSDIDCWAQCYAIKAIDNKIYAVIDSAHQDWILFTYFNGSDFPTIAKFQVPYARCPVNCMTYDRGRFYVAVNEYDISNVFQWAHIFSHASYAVENASVSKIFSITTTTTSEVIQWLDFYKKWPYPIFMKYSTTYPMQVRRLGINGITDAYLSQGIITTQSYEVTSNQFGNLVKWVQIVCKSTIPAGCSIQIKYKWDQETSYTTLPTSITSTNQNQVVWWINRRYQKIKVQIIINSTGPWTPDVGKILLF